MEPYTYRSLLPAKHSIRLIQILPGLPGTEIHCRIIDYTIRDDRVSGLFEALSYVWGKTTGMRKIFVADMASSLNPNAREGYLIITPNLYDALEELRDPDFPRTMWIDAVCINQDDPDERASQVNFMARIYSYANQVVIYLGSGESSETRELFVAIEDAAEIARHPIDDPQPHHGDQSEHEDDKDFLSTALDNLLSRPWFSRVWVLQEAAAARNLLVKCGTSELPGMIFTKGVQCLQTRRLLEDKHSRGLSASVLETMTWNTSTLSRSFSRRLSESLRGRTVSHGLPLGYLIEKFYLHGVTDRRDTIYALLNLCSPDSRRFMKPNYTKTWAEVWTDTIKQILGSETIVTINTERDQACMTLSGYVLGKVSLSDGTFSILRKNWKRLFWKATWTLESWCKSIQENDIVFLAVGATTPSVIRACGDHFDIITIALPTPLSASIHHRGLRESSYGWQDSLPFLKHGSRRVNLVWDWSPDYPNSRTSHILLFESACATPKTHPDEFARIADFIHIMATVDMVDIRWGCEFHESGRAIFAYLYGQSKRPELPYHLKAELRVLHMISSFRDRERCEWLIGQVEKLRYTLWVLTQQTEVEKQYDLLNFFKSEGYPHYTIFDLISIVGIEAHLSMDDTVATLHFIDGLDGNKERIFDGLCTMPSLEEFQQVSEEHHTTERGSALKSGIRQRLCEAFVRHSGIALADIRTSPTSILASPFNPQEDTGAHSIGNIRFNVAALAIIAACRGSALTWSQFDLSSTIRDPSSLRLCIRVFPESLFDLPTTYNMLSAILSLDSETSHISLQERVVHYQVIDCGVMSDFGSFSRSKYWSRINYFTKALNMDAVIIRFTPPWSLYFSYTTLKLYSGT